MAITGVKRVAQLALLLATAVAPQVTAQGTNGSLGEALKSINQILRDYPIEDPAVNWRRQRLDVEAGQLVVTLSVHGLDGSVQANRVTARPADLERAVWSDGRVSLACRDNAPCAQTWEGFELRRPLPSRPAALTLDTSATGEVAARLLTACQRLGDLLRANPQADGSDSPGRRPK